MFNLFKKKVLVGRVNAKYTFKDDAVKFHFNLFVKGTKRLAELVVTQNRAALRRHVAVYGDEQTDLCKRHHMYRRHVEPWIAGEDLEPQFVIKHRDLISADLRNELLTLFELTALRTEPTYDRLKKATRL